MKRPNLMSTTALGLAGVLCSVQTVSAAPSSLRHPTATLAPTAGLSADELRDIDAKVQAVRAQADRLIEDPESGTESLRQALRELAEAGRLAALHSKAHAVRIDGLLTLARTELALEHEADAIEALDEGVRVARGDELPVKNYGPSLVDLHKRRISASKLRPIGSLHVTCTRRCRVVLDGRTAGVGTDVMVSGVPLGRHRVDVETHARDVPDHMGKWFTLAAATPSQRYAFEAPEPRAAVERPTTTKTPGRPASERKLPRWAGITGMAAAGAAMIAGATLIGVHGGCPDGTDPDGETPCYETLDTRTLGIVLLSGGTASLVGFSIAFAIGEKKDRKHRASTQRSMTLGATLRF